MSKPRPCQVCAHPSVAAIDQALTNGKSARAIARTFGFATHHPVIRHQRVCMAAALAAVAEQQGITRVDLLAERVRRLDDVVAEIIRRNAEGERVDVVLDDVTGERVTRVIYNDRVLLAAVREARENAVTLARLVGADDGADAAQARLRTIVGNDDARAHAAAMEEALHAAAERARADTTTP